MSTIGHFERLRALCGNARLLVTGGVRAAAKSQVVIFDHAASKVRHTLELPAHVLGMALAGERLLCACADGALRIFEVTSGKELQKLAAHRGACTAVAVSGADPASERIYTAGADGRVRSFRADGQPAGDWVVSGQGLRAVAVDPSGQYVAAAGDDGIVHVLTPDTPGPLRDMPGHDGPVNALCFTPRDGRLVSGGEDGSLRIWYLVGAIESEVRTTDGQAAPVLALVFPPTPAEPPDGSAPTDRVFAASADGKLRAFRLDERRKPRTLDCGSKPLHALCFLPPAPSAASSSLGSVVTAGDGRTVYRFTLDTTGSPADKATTYDHGFDALAATFGSAKPAREATYLLLAGLEDSEALELLLRQLGADKEKEPELRALIARELGQRGRKPARAALRQALDDGHALVRAAALLALRAIEGAQALGPLRAALGSRYPDVRVAALGALGELGESSPLVPGLITSALTDSDAGVRLAALEATTALYPKDSPEPLRLCFERGPADLRIEALVRAAFAGLLTTPELSRLLSRALDDDDGEVRRLAFALQVLLRKRLSDLLADRDEDFSRTVQEIARRRVLRLRALKPTAATATAPSDQELAAARAELTAVLARREAALTAADPSAIKTRIAQPDRGPAGGGLSEDDLQPLLTAMACRTPATALRGARGLALLGDTRALGALLQLSRESTPELRREAAAALKALNDPRARRRLVWMLDDADAGVRAAALDAYSELCGRAATVDELAIAEAALRSSYEDIRVRGLQRLIQLGQVAAGTGPRSPQVEALLSNALEDEAPKVRAEALRTLWSWHEPDPAAVLDRALAARFPDLRLRAVEELLRLGEAGWAQGKLRQAIADRDADVAQAAYDAVVKLRGQEDAEAHLLAAASIHRKVREAGARGAAQVTGRGAPSEPLRTTLLKLLADEDSGVRLAALAALDRLLPKDAGPLHAGLASGYLDLRVRAAELLAERRDERLIEPMRALLGDTELSRRYPAAEVARLRLHAATALANLGAPATVKYQATELVKDSSPEIREQAARGLATAARPGDEGYLLDLLGHPDIWVRSWAADGLARLGDSRALPVLTGTLRHEHLPIRFSAIISFVALGPEGYGGVLQGLEDPNREVQELVFAIILSRDLQAFRRGQPPDLLVSALSSQRAEVRFAAARALELRVEPEAFLAHVIEALMPPRPDKAQDMKDWPSEEARGHILLGLIEALGSDRPDLRYAAATVLRLRRKPLEYFREAQRLSRPRAADAQVVPDTAPRAVDADAPAPKRGLLRRLFHGDEPLPEARRPAPSAQSPIPNLVSAEDAAHLRRLAFGAYVGLLRQVSTSTDEERVRRDAVDRIVELGLDEGIGRGAALPPVVRALDDPQYLVRKAAFAGLKRLFPAGSDEPLRLALRGAAADVARAALDEFAARGASATGPIAAALSSQLAEVRRYAFELLERLSEKGSLEPLLLALQSEYADLRIGVIERLATQSDSRVTAALQRAMESDHADLRLRAAELLVERRDDRAADVLGAFLRAEDSSVIGRARAALVRLRSDRAVRALAARLERDEDTSGAQLGARVQAALSLGQTGNPEAVEPLASCLEDEAAELRKAAFDAALELAQRAAPRPREKDAELPLPFGGPDGDKVFVRRDEALLLRFLRTAARAKDPAVRLRAAEELGSVRAASAGPPGSEADELLGALLSDRAVEVRRAAVSGYSRRVLEHGAAVEPLLDVLRTGARELLLPAAEGAAARGQAAALRPLLLFSRAGEADERPRALLSLGTLGDVRALPELETVAAGGTEEAPLDPESGPAMKAAAIEALGRLAAQGKPSDPEARRRVIERVEEASESAPETEVRQAAVRGLRPIGGERVRARLESILLDESAPSDVRAEAARQLGHMKDTAAETALARALSDWDSDVHTEARRALDRLFPGERTRVEFLAVDSSQDEISEPAAAYLAVAGDPALLVPRLATLKDEELRARLRYGLLRRPGLAVRELVALLGHDDPSAREAAAWLLGTRAGQGGAVPATAASALLAAERRTAERFLLTAPERRDAEERAWVRLLWAAANTAAPGSPEVAARARELLPGSRSAASVPGAVRQQAVRALVRHLRPGEAEAASAVLSAALEDADPLVREAAAAALAKLVPERAFGLAVAVRPSDPVAFAPAAQRPKTDELRSPEGRRLGLPGVLAARDSATLLPLLRDPDAAVRLDAVAGLGRTGGEPAIAALRALAFDKKGADEALRKAAYRAYRRAKRRTEQQKKYEAQP